MGTSIDDLKGMARVAMEFWRGSGQVEDVAIARPPTPPGSGGELISFATVGFASTVAYLVLLFALRSALGLLAANAVALTATMLANTGLHRRWTFGRRGSRGRRREWLRSAAVHLAGLAVTSAAIVGAQAIDGGSGMTLFVLLLTASAMSTGLRFLLMPAWIFRKS
jgi:putative flippase GtrA